MAVRDERPFIAASPENGKRLAVEINLQAALMWDSTGLTIGNSYFTGLVDMLQMPTTQGAPRYRDILLQSPCDIT